MERSKISHTSFDYECGQATANVNIYTGRLIVTTNDLTVGAGNFEISVGHVFNSQFKNIRINSYNDVIGFNNGWKLNIQAYVFEYQNAFNFEGFETGDYVYIDSSFNVHRFVKYIEGDNDVYYDKSGLNLRLTVYENGLKEIVDSSGNKLKFNYFGMLVRIISGVNEGIEKVIEYDDEKYYVRKVYDIRNMQNCINFYYTDDKLSYIQNGVNRINIRYSYNSLGMLSRITKERYNAKKDILYLDYDEESDVNLIIDMQTSKALKITYPYSGSNKRVMNIIKKGSKRAGCEVKEDYFLASGENNYIGDDLYVGEVGMNYEHKYDIDDYSYEEYNVSINPVEESFVTTRCNDIKKIYFVDKEGNTISTVEEIKHVSFYEASYRSLEKISGLSIYGKKASEYIGEDISRREYNISFNGMMNDIITNQVVNISSEKIGEIKNSFGENSESYKYIEKFNLSFYVNFPKSDLYYTAKVNITYKDSDDEEVVSTIGKKHIGELPLDSWAFVNIPINFNDYKNSFESLKIVFEGREANSEEVKIISTVNVADIRLAPNRSNDCYVYGENINSIIGLPGTANLKTVSKVNYVDLDNQEKEIIIDTDDYITENDLYETYKSIYLNKTMNNNHFDLIYNNGKKVLRVLHAYLITFFHKIELKVSDNGIPNFYIHTFSKLGETEKDDEKVSITSTTTVSYNFHKDENNFIYYVENNTQTLNDADGENTSTSTTSIYKNGLEHYKIDAYGLKTQEFYDAYGNKLSTETFNKDNLDGERFITEYVYYEEDASLRRLPDEVIENGIKAKYVYEDNTYLLKEVIIGNQKIKYEYDVFLEKMMSVSFVDMLTNKTVATYKLFYDENNNIKNVTDNKGIDHSFSDKIEYDYNYNKFYQNQNQYYNNKLVQSNKSYDSMKFINNNYIRGSKIIQYITDDISNESLVAYDKYERIAKHQENDKEILYQYGSDELYKDLNKITDPYSNQDYEYLYDESNNNYGYKVSESNNSNYKLKLTNLPNRVEYSFNNDEYCKSSYTIHENNKSIIDEVFKNEKVKKYINDILAGEEILVSPRVFSTIEFDSDVNSKNMEFMHLYLYDSLGRIKSNVNPLYCYIDDGSSSESSDSKVLTINKYYKNGSNLVSSTVEKLNTFPHNSVAFSNQLVYNEYSYDNLGNVTKVNQTGIYFYKNSENKLYNTNLTPYTKEYEYDSFNRLVKEITEVDNENISTIIYKYNDLGYLSKVLKDEALQKEFIYDNGRLVKYNKYGLTYDIMYDNYGNMLTSYNHDYTYNNSNKLSKVYLIDSKKTIENKYNYQGIRCEKIIKDKDGNIENKIKYYLDDKKIHREDRLDRNNNIINTIRYYYDINGICGLRYNNKNYTLIKDELGNISRIMYQGILVAEYRYDAWGNNTIKYYSIDTDEREAANINPFRYKGYYYDDESSLYYLNSRYYSPELCRFISPDDIEYLDPKSVNGLNLYCYCGNNPVNNIDPSGHLFWSCLLGAAISLVVEFAIDYFEDDSRTIDHSLNDYFAAGISGAISGGFGSSKNAIVRLGGAVVSSVAQGIMTEGLDYNLNSLKQDVTIGLASFGIAEGISIASKRIVGGIIKKASQKTTKEAGRQISSMMKGHVVKNLKPNAKKIYRRAILGIAASKTNEYGTGALYSFITGISNSTIFEW